MSWAFACSGYRLCAGAAPRGLFRAAPAVAAVPQVRGRRLFRRIWFGWKKVKEKTNKIHVQFRKFSYL